MSEYIDREMLKARFEEDGHLSAYIEEMIDDVPAADVRPVKRGEWEEHGEPNQYGQYEPWYYKCTRCGAVGSPEFNYCPHCGALMESDDDV